MEHDIRDEDALAFWRAFGVVLAEARRERGMSQDELAERAGLHRTFISRVERATQAPSLLAIYSLAGALETVPSDLIRRVEDRMASA